ncbi:hypothetical protein VCHA28O22_100039 [Vibrio chagasii]|nr:hypothetical protein VCHA28O22_100039 [Vibrio chagasii]CAH6905427.1 hypothetical protein VCHA41O246_100023 [Vibrio chagasii]CAH6990643.1 hypothetical protein VCHA50O393_150107 [Vibrio chagasii]CAH7013912.1 hypothetical protein VCHA53O474_150109 [Vibrio chagasii]
MPCFSAPIIIVLNFNISKDLPCKPSRLCLNNASPLESSLTSKNIIIKIGEKMNIKNKENKTSNKRLNRLYTFFNHP